MLQRAGKDGTERGTKLCTDIFLSSAQFWPQLWPISGGPLSDEERRYQ